MNGSHLSTRRAPNSAPTTPKIINDRIELGEYRLPFVMAQQQANTIRRPKGRADELIISTKEEMDLSGGSFPPLSPITPKQSPLPLMPASPASSVAMSPTRKESYKDLITRAISSHPDKLMTLSDIYAWIVANVEAYRDQSHIPSTQGWKNAIRHTLSFYKCFKRVKRHPSIEKPSYWTIDYSEQQGSASSSTAPAPSRLVAASPKPRPPSTSGGIIARPSPITPNLIRASTSAVREENIIDERSRVQDMNASTNDLRAWAANWPMRTDSSHATKEEQCIQGLLLFRTSGGFSFLPQPNESSRPTSTITTTSNVPLPKFASPNWTIGGESTAADILTYTSCAQVYSQNTIHPGGQQSMSRLENGSGTIQTMGGRQATTMVTGSLATVVVDTLSGPSRAPTMSSSTWTTASSGEKREPPISILQHEQQQNIFKQHQQQQRKPQLQKRYVEAQTQSQPLQVQQQQPQSQTKPESVSYVQLIANAILASPEKRATLAQIYEWLVMNVAAFQGQGSSPSSVGWKNAVRHTLSTRPFFKRVICEEAYGRQKPAWWTVDVEAMNLASSLRQQQQQSQLKMSKRRKNGHNGHGSLSESSSMPLASNSLTLRSSDPMVVERRSGVTVICRTGDDLNAMIVGKAMSEPLQPICSTIDMSNEEIKWPNIATALHEKEPTSSSPESSVDNRMANIFRYPSSSVSSRATTVSTCKSELISPNLLDKSIISPILDVNMTNLVFESAIGLGSDVFECLVHDFEDSFELISPWSKILSPRDALTYTLLRLRRHPNPFENVQYFQQRRHMRKLFLRWLTFLSSRVTALIYWPESINRRLPPPYLTDRLISFERMRNPEHVVGILDIFTLDILLDQSDDCCRKTINALIVYNFDGSIIFRSKRLYWLDCRHDRQKFQNGLRSMIDADFVETTSDLKHKLSINDDQQQEKILLTYKKFDDILPPSIHVIKSKNIRNLLRDKFADRLSRFDILSKSIILKRKGSVTMLANLDETLTACLGLVNLSAPILWEDDGM